MSPEHSTGISDWEAFGADLDAGREREAALLKTWERLSEVLAYCSDWVEELTPDLVASSVNFELKEAGWKTQRGVVPVNPDSVPGLKEADKADFLVDVVTTDPITSLTTALQVGFTIPKRSRVLAVNFLFPQPDLAVFTLIKPPYSRSKKRTLSTLETALWDVESELRVYHMLRPWGEAVLMDTWLRDAISRQKGRQTRQGALRAPAAQRYTRG